MSKPILKYILILLMYLASNQNSWSAASLDSVSLSPPPSTTVPCNMSFYTTLYTNPANQYYGTGSPSWSPGQILAFFSKGAPTNMCPNITYNVELVYTVKAGNCGGGICCGFGDFLNYQPVTSGGVFAIGSECFPANTTVTLVNRGTWAVSVRSIQQFVNLFTTGSSDGANFVNGSIYIHYP